MKVTIEFDVRRPTAEEMGGPEWVSNLPLKASEVLNAIHTENEPDIIIDGVKLVDVEM